MATNFRSRAFQLPGIVFLFLSSGCEKSRARRRNMLERVSPLAWKAQGVMGNVQERVPDMVMDVCGLVW